MGHVHTRVYRKGALEAEDLPLASLSEPLADPESVVWIDLCGPSRDQLHQLSEELGLHELAVEDALEPHQRPKLDVYESHLFLSCRAVRVDAETGRLHETQVDAFADTRWLVTVREDDGFPVDALVRRWDASPDLAEAGVSYLLYGLLDLVVDRYLDALEVFDELYDQVSEGIFYEHPLTPDQQRRWFDMRRSLVRFHRVVVPMRETVSSLMRRERSFVPEALHPYYQDVYDHLLRVTETTDMMRDLVSTIVETNISLRDYRQNQVMKKVSSWAAIIAVPTLVTGYYGMNVPFPGSGRTLGVVTSTLLVALLSLLLYIQFKRRDWL